MFNFTLPLLDNPSPIIAHPATFSHRPDRVAGLLRTKACECRPVWSYIFIQLPTYVAAVHHTRGGAGPVEHYILNYLHAIGVHTYYHGIILPLRNGFTCSCVHIFLRWPSWDTRVAPATANDSVADIVSNTVFSIACYLSSFHYPCVPGPVFFQRLGILDKLIWK